MLLPISEGKTELLYRCSAQRFRLQVKERDNKDKCTCKVQVCASAYTLVMILLYCIVLIIMPRIHALTVTILALEGAK